MSISTSNSNTSYTSSKERSPLTGTNPHPSSTSFNAQHFVNERYPKTCLEDIPSIILEYPRPKVGNHSTRSRNSLRFRTQPVTLTEINETDEENKPDNDHQQESQPNVRGEFDRLEHLALLDSRRRSARKKLPLKNYLERQRLKSMREEPSETDGN